MTDKVLIDRALLQDLIDDVSDYAESRVFKQVEWKWRTELLEKARALLAAGAKPLGRFEHECTICHGRFLARYRKSACVKCRNAEYEAGAMARAGIACLQRYSFRPNTLMNSLDKDAEGSWLRYSDVVRVIDAAIAKESGND